MTAGDGRKKEIACAARCRFRRRMHIVGPCAPGGEQIGVDWTHARRLVVRPAHHVRAVGRHAHRAHVVCVALEHAHHRAVGHRPHARRLVVWGRYLSERRALNVISTACRAPGTPTGTILVIIICEFPNCAACLRPTSGAGRSVSAALSRMQTLNETLSTIVAVEAHMYEGYVVKDLRKIARVESLSCMQKSCLPLRQLRSESPWVDLV